MIETLPLPDLPPSTTTTAVTFSHTGEDKAPAKRHYKKREKRFVPAVEKNRDLPPLKIEETKIQPEKQPSTCWRRVIQVLSNEKNPKQWEVIGEYPSMSEAAKSVGASSAANIFAFVDKGKVYKERYKFVSKNF